MSVYRADPSEADPEEFLNPQNGFAMPTGVFIKHISKALDLLGLGLVRRTAIVRCVTLHGLYKAKEYA